MKKKLLAIALTLAASTAFAQQAGSMYGIVGYGVGKVNSDVSSFSASSGDLTYTQNSDTSGTGAFGGIGFNIDKNLAAEITYLDFGGFSANQTLTADNAVISGYTYDGTISVNQKIKANGFSVSAKYSYDLNKESRIYGRLGLARVTVKNDIAISGSGTVDGNSVSAGTGLSYKDTSTVPVIGLGFEYDLTQKVALRAEYMHISKVGDKQTTGESSVKFYNVQTVFKF
jgi:opacity protein-like surface antigen